MDKKTFFTRERLATIAILVLSALVYFPALRGLQILDDHVIANGAAIGGGKSLIDCFTHPFLYSYYRPLISASFWLEMRVWGANPFLLHQTNILIHVATTFLVIRLAGACGLSRKTALLAGLFFALQPAQVGAVAWIGGRTDDQACLFLVLMLLAIVRYFRDAQLWWIPIGVAAAVASMMTKEQVAPAVLAAPLAGLAFAASRRKILVGSVPYLAAGAIFLFFWFTLVPEHVKSATVPLSEILSQISRSTLNYTLLFVAPNPWSMNTYSLESLRSPLIIGLGAALTLYLPYAAWRLWKRNPKLGMLAIAAGLVYLPVSNLIPIPSLIAAPYRVAVCGPCVAILFAAFAGGVWERRKRRSADLNEVRVPALSIRRPRFLPVPLVASASIAVLAVGLCLVPWGASLHQDDITLFAAAARYDGGSLYMRANYIWSLSDKGLTVKALAESDHLLNQVYGGPTWRNYEEAAQRLAQDPRIISRVLSTHGARAEAGPLVSRYFVMHGQLLMKSHRDDEALRSMYAASRMDERDDSAFFGLGHMLLEKNPKLATHYLKRAIAINPTNVGAIYTLGHYYAQVGDYESAYVALRKIVGSERDTGMPLLDLADAEIRTGRVVEARETLRLASHMIIEPTRLASLEARANASAKRPVSL